MTNDKRRIKEPLRLKMKKRLVIGAVGLIVVGGASYASLSHLPTWLAGMEEFIAKTIDARVEHILVEGVKYTPKQDMSTALGLSKGDSLVGFDAKVARDRLEDLPWVRDAVVERKLPSTVTVKLYEYHPIARLEVENQIWVVEKTGTRIVPVENEFTDLPLIKGEGADAEAADMIMLLQMERDASLPKVAEATYIGNRRWNLGFETGGWVMLPEENPAKAMEILKKLQKSKRVLDIDGGMVDLRLEDRIVLRMPPNTKKKERSL